MPVSFRTLAAAVVATCLAACATTPANLDDAKRAVVAYHDDGRYARDVASVAEAARAYLASRIGQVARPAIVIDVDETAISNWDRMRANDMGYIADGDCARLPRGPCGTLAWIAAANAPAIEPVLALYRFARSRGVAVFFMSGRRERLRDATAANLRRAGYDGCETLVLLADDARPAAFKAAERAQIEAAGWTIVLNLGDQPSDLDGGHAERGFLLPNPFYKVQ